MDLLGRGFSLVPQGWSARFQGQQSVLAAYGAGLVYGLAGFCAGPLLGAVLALAATAPSPTHGAALLFAYSLGTAAPLFGLAYCWDRFGLGRRRWLRGRAVHVGPLTVHSTNLVGGLLFILLGVAFIVFQGGSVLSGLYADLRLEELGFTLQSWVADHLAGIPDLVWLAALGAAALAVVVGRRLGTRRPRPVRVADRP
jgi:hypothetical protein